MFGQGDIVLLTEIENGRIETLVQSGNLKCLKDVEEAALLVGEHVPGVVSADLVHGPAAISGASRLGWKNHRAEARFRKAVILGCADAAGITPATIILTEIAVLGGQIQAPGYDCTAFETCADI